MSQNTKLSACRVMKRNRVLKEPFMIWNLIFEDQLSVRQNESIENKMFILPFVSHKTHIFIFALEAVDMCDAFVRYLHTTIMQIRKLWGTFNILMDYCDEGYETFFPINGNIFVGKPFLQTLRWWLSLHPFLPYFSICKMRTYLSEGVCSWRCALTKSICVWRFRSLLILFFISSCEILMLFFIIWSRWTERSAKLYSIKPELSKP